MSLLEVPTFEKAFAYCNALQSQSNQPVGTSHQRRQRVTNIK
ncbi:hypothetical protein Plhal304r1_c072g0160781 [Plasmopara halstedii]